MNHFLRRRHQFRIERLNRAIRVIGALTPDWIFCTGDLTTVSDAGEFSTAVGALKPISKLATRGFVYVPGNHDAYVEDPESLRILAETCRELNGFPQTDFPTEITDRGLRMYFVDETLPTPFWLSSGELGEASRNELKVRFGVPREENEVRILVGHFPMRRANGQRLSPRRRLVGDEWLFNEWRSNHFDISLCGHVHHGYVRDDANEKKEICSGSLTLEGRLNVLDYFPESGDIRQFWINVDEEHAISNLTRKEVLPGTETLVTETKLYKKTIDHFEE